MDIRELRERRFPTLKNEEVRCPDLGQLQRSTRHECAMVKPRPAKPIFVIIGLGPPGKLPLKCTAALSILDATSSYRTSE